MIDGKTKTKLLEELEKTGNVWIACTKVGISRATYYRWLKEDKKFGKLAKEALTLGRDNMCDIAEHALALKIKEGDFNAIKYQLGHNSPFYKPRMLSKVILEHRRKIQKSDLPPPVSIEDILDQYGLGEDSLPPEPDTKVTRPVQNAQGTAIILPMEEES